MITPRVVLDTGASQSDLPYMGMTTGAYVCNGGVHLTTTILFSDPSPSSTGYPASHLIRTVITLVSQLNHGARADESGSRGGNNVFDCTQVTQERVISNSPRSVDIHSVKTSSISGPVNSGLGNLMAS